MNNNKKTIIICAIAALVILAVVIIITLVTQLTGFSIILITLFIILTICLSIYIKEAPDEFTAFIKEKKRILRTYGNKQYANIYDVIVLPSWETEKMAEIELRRFYEYARLAVNKDELLLQLESLAGDYGLELDDFVTTFDDEDDEKEADLDD